MIGIIALNKKGCIGKNGKLPWRCSDDLKHFKKLTMGKRCVVGRKTYEKLPKLKGRELLVVSSVNKLSEALDQNPEVIIGGKSIYKQLLPLCKEIHVSLIDDDSEGDTYFEIPSSLKDRCIYYNFKTD